LTLWNQKNLSPPPGIKPQFLGHPTHSLVPTPTMPLVT